MEFARFCWKVRQTNKQTETDRQTGRTTVFKYAKFWFNFRVLIWFCRSCGDSLEPLELLQQLLLCWFGWWRELTRKAAGTTQFFFCRCDKCVAGSETDWQDRKHAWLRQFCNVNSAYNASRRHQSYLEAQLQYEPNQNKMNQHACCQQSKTQQPQKIDLRWLQTSWRWLCGSVLSVRDLSITSVQPADDK